MQDNFSMFVPFDVLEKGKDEDGKEVMIIGGIVSDETTGADLDGDIIEIEGMDLSKFMKSGFVNFNHLAGKDPSMIIGEPISFEKKNGKLMVKSKLYSDSEMAKKVYDLANTLDKSSSTRRLGYSIEGSVVSRSEKDSRRIKKSAMSGLAVAPHPKCHGTGVIISKGIVEYESLDNSEFLIDITDEAGTRWTVDNTLEIKKAMVAGSITGTETIDQNSTQEALKEESIDGVTGKKKKKKSIKDLESKEFSKGEVFTLLIQDFDLDATSCKHIWQLAEAIEKGGEGSKGGHVIGHTKSGKPIYNTYDHPAHKDFNEHDHDDAHHIHDLKSQYKKGGNTAYKPGEKKSEEGKRHATEARKHFIHRHELRIPNQIKGHEKLPDAIKRIESEHSRL